MGIDYLSCKNCGDAFPDVINYVSCECGVNWCCNECATEDVFHEESCSKGYGTDVNDCEIPCWRCDDHVDSSCKYCRGEDFDDSDLLEFALTQLGKSRNELIESYKESKGV